LSKFSLSSNIRASSKLIFRRYGKQIPAYFGNFNLMTQLPLLQRHRIFQHRLLTHVLFWLGYVSFFALVSGRGEDSFWEGFQYELLMLPAKMAVVYLTLYVLIPRFLLRKQQWQMALLFLLILGLAGALQRVVVYYVIYPIQYQDLAFGYGPFWDSDKLFKHMLQISFVVVLASAVKIQRYWHQYEQASKALERDKLEAELNFLKAQIHPHFLFNTLNNLYSLTLKKSDLAPEVVLRLSGLVNYMLYDTRSSAVPLSKEVESLHHYIALEKIRYGSNLEIGFDVSGQIDGAEVAPMLLLPFVENSFKHGVSDEITDKWITINLTVNEEMLTFKVENAKSPGRIPGLEKDYTGGIGLKNVRRRLELLYPNRHELKILDEAHSYLIVMKITLA
jgi:two-component system LytT family sensor kinase